jgi:hypothetical protein
MAEAHHQGRVGLLQSWTTEVGHLALQGPGSFTLDYPAPPRDLTPRECAAAGFGFHNERSAHSGLSDVGSSIVRIDFSPDLYQQAVLVKGSGSWSGALLWVNSEAIPVPRAEDGNPLCAQSAQWVDERFVYVEMGGLWNHPLLDPNKVDPLGEIRGLLIWDAIKHVQHAALPEADQAWTAPILIARDTSWLIYPHAAAFKQDRPDRVVPIPR